MGSKDSIETDWPVASSIQNSTNIEMIVEIVIILMEEHELDIDTRQ